ncbi:UDP-glucosyltransferase 2-like [Achroia grisella]|uniref:UDP-glucosyltransferase 2-like n=1 Tax=Achroia grisella TaxID=688607 RepID=UPI0027D253EE|nr:UDP-glucosyltransferase 2-like [Achroia grisella]
MLEEVTYITPGQFNESSTKLRLISVASHYDDFPAEKILNLKDIIENTFSKDFGFVQKLMFHYANTTVFHKNVQSLLQDPMERFDAVIAEYMFSGLYSGFSSVFNCPLIWSVPMQPHNTYIALIDAMQNPAYTYNYWSHVDPPFSFKERVTELYRTMLNSYYIWYFSGIENESFIKAFASAAMKRGNVLPPYNEVKYNASLVLGNSDVPSGHAMRLPAAYKHIAGYHIIDIPPLSENLQEIMDSAQDGVIYFSMGSIFRSKDLPNNMKRELLKVFASLKQTVIWKFEEPLPNLPKNVHVMDWAPQKSILAHQNCMLFITHGGVCSVIEAIHYAVPIIGLPAYIDQFMNINRAVKKGFGKRVDLDSEMPKNLKQSIEDVLENSRYKEKVKEYSMIYHHRLVSPSQELVYWVEHVVYTQGAPHLRSTVQHVPFYQKLHLDLIVVTSIVMLASMKLLRHLFVLVMKHLNIKRKIE